jgi:NAD(P)-dependent dehydrogenase (short-subunit alcohol dehydrogenase family)
LNCEKLVLTRREWLTAGGVALRGFAHCLAVRALRSNHPGPATAIRRTLGERVAGGIGGVFCRVDVTSKAEVDAGFVRSRGLIGQERILVNCAGTGNVFKTAGRDRESGEIRHFQGDGRGQHSTPQ